MPRYRTFGRLDDPETPDGDQAFLGFRSRVQPTSLPQGITRYLGNMRCERGTIRPRKGAKAMATDIALTNAAVILEFDLPAEYTVTIVRTGGTARATFTGTPPATLTTADIASVDGATQAAYNGDFTITAVDAGRLWFEYAVAGAPATPATGTIKACFNAPALYETANDQVRGSCEVAFSDRTEGSVLACTDSAYLCRVGVASVAIAYPTGESIQSTDVCGLVQFLGYCYLFRGYQTSAAFTLSGITQAAGVATATSVSPHGRATNDWVLHSGTVQNGYKGIFQITVTGANTYTFAVDPATVSPATGSPITARPCKPPLYWDLNPANDFLVVPAGPNPLAGTLIRMPAVDWGIYFNRRLILGYTPDELIMSGFGVADSYDKQYGQLRVVPGADDWLIGALGYQLVKVLIGFRKSMHLLSIDPDTGASVQVEEITRQVGCVARRTLQTCGDLILWLSDVGVMALQMGLELNLRAARQPLSDAIQDQIDLINWTYAGAAVARFWNNRYYIAVPTGSSVLNNTVLVYNFLTQEWESVDSYQGTFDVQNFLVLDYQGKQRLHAVTTFGFIFLLEELEVDEFGNTPVITSYTITGTLRPRHYTLGILREKTFSSAAIEVEAGSADDAFTVDFVSRNPDSRVTLPAYDAAAANDETYQQRVRQRGVAGSVEIVTTGGRPEFKSITVDARVPGGNLKSKA
jgi:hypothetical protein